MKQQLKAAIQRLHQGRVLVVGDVVIDEMVYGSTDRISREAPVLILNHKNTNITLGAAGNAAHNISKLGAKRTTLAGVTGKDYYCSLLLDALQRDGIDTAGLVQDDDRPTSTKTRISGITNQSITQQIVRIDRESRTPLNGPSEAQLLDTLTTIAPEFDALLLSDYGLGVLTPTVIAHCQALAKQHNLLITVDSQRDLSAFQGVKIITPNQPEAENNVGFELDSPELVLKAGKMLLSKTNAESILITRGGDGMTLFEQSGITTHIPAFNRSEVFDVTGAGDTVVGTLTLALATGATLTEATILGNLAASITVKRFGAATTTPVELSEVLEQLDERVLKESVQQVSMNV